MRSAPELIADGVIRERVPLGPLTTYKSGGPARLFAEVDGRERLAELIGSGVTRDNEVLVLGRGSNLVVADSGFDGVVLKLGPGFAEIRVGAADVTAGGAAPLPRLARAAVDGGLRGLEFLAGVPGSVGGAVRQNAGCFGAETKDRLTEAEIVDLASGAVRRSGPEGLELSYRSSNVEPSDLVVEAVFRAEAGDPAAGRREIRRITRWRRRNQPGGTLNAGSVFKNPEHISAGELIDSLGLKGMSVGGVRVSARHANFFVADAGAVSDDIYLLTRAVRDRVLELTGTDLEPEIQFIGFDQ